MNYKDYIFDKDVLTRCVIDKQQDELFVDFEYAKAWVQYLLNDEVFTVEQGKGFQEELIVRLNHLLDKIKMLTNKEVQPFWFACKRLWRMFIYISLLGFKNTINDFQIPIDTEYYNTYQKIIYVHTYRIEEANAIYRNYFIEYVKDWPEVYYYL